MKSVGQIKVISPGLATCIQDTGRFGYRNMGVSLSGAMDIHSSMCANQMLGNKIDFPVLEVTMLGPELLFLTTANICICGADADIFLDDQAVNINTVIIVNAGQTLRWGRFMNGCRSYLAVKGGFLSEKVLGSVAFMKNTPLQYIQKGQLLKFKHQNNKVKTAQQNAVFQPLVIDEEAPVLAYEGPEWRLLNTEARKQISEENYNITSHADPIGYRMSGKAISGISKNEILTSAVLPGTVQLLPDGQLVILMRACQTTGGYPRILQIDEESINQLSQRRPGGKVRFIISALQF